MTFSRKGDSDVLTLDHVIYDTCHAVEIRRWENDRPVANFNIGQLVPVGGFVEFRTLPTIGNDPVIDAFLPLNGLRRRNAVDIVLHLAAHMNAVCAFAGAVEGGQ